MKSMKNKKNNNANFVFLILHHFPKTKKMRDLVHFSAELCVENYEVRPDDLIVLRKERDKKPVQILVNDKPIGFVSTLYNQHIMIADVIREARMHLRIEYIGHLSEKFVRFALVGP